MWTYLHSSTVLVTGHAVDLIHDEDVFAAHRLRGSCSTRESNFLTIATFYGFKVHFKVELHFSVLYFSRNQTWRFCETSCFYSTFMGVNGQMCSRRTDLCKSSQCWCCWVTRTPPPSGCFCCGWSWRSSPRSWSPTPAGMAFTEMRKSCSQLQSLHKVPVFFFTLTSQTKAAVVVFPTPGGPESSAAL